MPMIARLRGLSAADMERFRADPAALPAALQGPALVLERSWHGLHFLLCNDPWDGPEPLNQAILGGVPLDGEMGPRLLGPELVARIAQVLFPMNIPAVVADYRPAEFEQRDIYPGGWDFSAEWPRIFAHDLASLREFYRERAAAGEAVLIVIG